MVSLLLFFALQGGMPMKPIVQEAIHRNVWVETASHYGSGVILQSGYVLTNFHMLEVESDVKVNDKAAVVIAADPEHDLILLKADTGHFALLKFSVKTQVLDMVFYVGNPDHHLNFVSMGVINLKIEDWIYTSCAGVGGASGSGLYNLQGELIGMTQGEEGHVITVHIGAKTILNFLEANKKLLK